MAMIKNGVFDARSVCALVNATADWSAGDVFQVGGHFLTLMPVDGSSLEKSEAIKSLTKLWSRSIDFKDEIQASGFVVLENHESSVINDVMAGVKKKLRSRDDEAGMTIGIVAADIQRLEQEYHCAKEVLSSLGLCREDLPRMSAKGATVKLSQYATTESSTSVFTAIKSKISGGVGIFEVEGEHGTQKESRKSTGLSISTEQDIDGGAVRSAFIMNAIASEAKISTLGEISSFRSLRAVIDQTRPVPDEQKKLIEEIRDDLLASKETLKSITKDYLEKAKEQFAEAYVGSSVNNERRLLSKAKEMAVMVGLDNMIRVFDEATSSGVTAGHLKSMDAISGAMDGYDPGSWISAAGVFGMHALLLSGALQHEAMACEAVLAAENKSQRRLAH